MNTCNSNGQEASKIIDLHPLKVLLHQGHRSLGGNLFEIAHQNGHRLFVDLGLPLVGAESRQEFGLDWARLGRDPEAGLKSLRELGLPPAGLGIFADEMPRLCAGIALTHAHVDHWGLLPFLRDGLTIYAGSTTRRLIEWQCLWHGVRLPRLEWQEVPDTGCIELAMGRAVHARLRAVRADHSIPGSMGFIFECSTASQPRRLCFSGDFRTGDGSIEMLAEKFRRFGIFGETDLLVTEGTHWGGRGSHRAGPSEADVLHAAQRLLARQEGLVTFSASALHQTRLRILAVAAERSGRSLVLDLYGALSILAADGHLGLFRVLFSKSQMARVLRRRGQDGLPASHAISEKALDACRRKEVGLSEIMKDPGAWLLQLRGGLLPDLERHAAAGWGRLPTPVVHIHSLWKGYLKPDDRLTSWLCDQGVPVQTDAMHASGHSSHDDLRRFIRHVGACRTVMVHGLETELGDLEQNAGTILNSRRRKRSLALMGKRGFTLRDWVGEQHRLFQKPSETVKRLARRRGFLDEEVEAALIELGPFNGAES